MFDLVKISTAHPVYKQVEHLLHAAFPEDERRDDILQRQNTDENPEFRCYAVTLQNGEFAGLLTSWHFGNFRYIEHFAIDPSKRNLGIGANVLSAFISQDATPIVLEVELPEDEMSRRRIGFYERQGLSLFDAMEYVQPPYRDTGHSLPMHLMSSSNFITSSNFEEVKDTLLRRVYGINK